MVEYKEERHKSEECIAAREQEEEGFVQIVLVNEYQKHVAITLYLQYCSRWSACSQFKLS